MFDLSIIGTVGLPAAYGGFETLAEQLARRLAKKWSIQVLCSAVRYPNSVDRPTKIDGITLGYVNWDANGWQSIPYDMASLFRAAGKSKTLLVLGVSGCIALPIIRVLWPRTQIVTNIDGVEWKRQKWGKLARLFLRISELAAILFSHKIIADNQGICDHVQRHYGRQCFLIAYGGDQAFDVLPEEGPPPEEGATNADTLFEPGSYFFSLCRIEPENNIVYILKAFASLPAARLVLVGNWGGAAFAQNLYAQYSAYPNIELCNPIYDQSRLRSLRSGAKAYIHGHSAGGTNPSLVEAMYAAMPILAFDVDYNRHTTDHAATYWSDDFSLRIALIAATPNDLAAMGERMRRIAEKQYTWTNIIDKYRKILFAA